MKSIAASIVVLAGAFLIGVGFMVWPRDNGGVGSLIGGILCLAGIVLLGMEIRDGKL